MTITFLTGKSGSGKTTTVLNKITNQLIEEPNGNPIVLIVPEQMTFLAEYKIVSNEDVKGMIRCQVYSFTRLAWKLLQETGYMNKQFLDSVGVSMLIQKIVEENAKNLHLFHKAAEKQGFIAQVEQMITEFKRYCIEPEQLMMEVDDVILKEKIHDLQLIYTKFQEQLEGNYLLGEDYLRLLANQIEHSLYIKNATIYIDGFYDLTTLEYTLLEQIVKHAKEVVISFTLDRPFDNELPSDMHLFRKSGEYYYELAQICKRNQLPYTKVHLEEQVRFQNKAIAHIEQNFSNYPLPKYSDATNVLFIQAANKRAEVEEVGREIIRLMQNENYRYKDIVILYRDQNEYGPYIETVLQDFDIPTYVDMKKTMQNHPFIEMVRALLSIIETNFKYEAVFRYLKTGLVFPYFEKEGQWTYNDKQYFKLVDKMENYCLEYGIRGNRYKKTWNYRSSRLPAQANEDTKNRYKEQDKELDNFRQLFVEPIIKLQELFKKKKTGLEICTALFQLFEQLKVADTLGSWKYKAEKEGYLEKASMHEQAWNHVIDLLDQYVEIMGDEAVNIETFVSIVDAGLQAMDFALVPQAIDQVVVANLEQSRVYDVKVAFVVGMTDSALPLKRNSKEIVTDSDRQRLKDNGVKLAPSGIIRLLDEEFIAYRAFTTASEKLYISYPIADEEGKALMPSMYIKRIKSLLPTIETKLSIVDPIDLEEEEQKQYIVHPESTLSYLIGQLKKQQLYPIAPLWYDVKHFYETSPVYKAKLEKLLHSINYENRTEKLQPELAENLFTAGKKQLVASVSRMEKFNSCHFSHFAHYGLNLRQRKIYRLETFDIGELFHEGLRILNERVKDNEIKWSDLTKEKSRALAEEIVEQVSQDRQKVIFTEEKHSYLRYKLAETLAATIYRIGQHGQNSDFVPVKLEFEFGKQDDTKPIVIGDNASMRITGKIDRIDEWKIENKTYVRIIDYKSSSHDIDLSDVFNGLQLQMITYLDNYLHLEKEAKEAAGMLYFHVHNPFISTKKLLEEEKLEGELQKKYQMKGLVLDNLAIIKAMDKEMEADSKIIPVGIKKDGEFKKHSKVISKDEFKILQKYVNKKFQQSGNTILAGDVAINPYKVDKFVPCTYCDFKSVCQFDDTLKGNSYRKLPKLSKEIVFEEMEKVIDESTAE